MRASIPVHAAAWLRRPAVVLALPCALLGAAPAWAQGAGAARYQRECAEWIAKKGFSTDYIEQRTGQRPSGNVASDWIANLDPKEAGPNDVVFMYIDSPDGKAQRAEVVDEVLRNPDGSIKAFRTSSMNNGKMVEWRCRITDKFGEVTSHTVAFDRVIRAWRAGR